MTAIPIFQVSDSRAAEAHYCGRLGFQLAWAMRPVEGSDDPCYMEVEREGVTLHLSSFSGDGAKGSAAMVRVPDVDALHREFLARGVEIDTGPVDQTWGLREMYIKDADRNSLRFTHVISP